MQAVESPAFGPRSSSVARACTSGYIMGALACTTRSATMPELAIERDMARRHDIDRILKEWPYEPGEISARLVRATDGREVLQMRVEMGVLQLEIDGPARRPAARRSGHLFRPLEGAGRQEPTTTSS